jgi:hypothetical protein
MCCRRNTGLSKPTDGRLGATPWQSTKMTVLLWQFLIGSAFLIGTIGLHGCYRAGDTAPWFGRGQNLPKAPITVLVGPIDLDRGIVGVLELDMRRKEVEAVLGKPLVGPMSQEEALRRGIDPEDVMNNLYGGVFAWVQYNYRNEVISIEFTPRALKERMGLEQKLLIRVGNRTLVLSSKTHRRDVESFVRGVQFKKLRDYGHYMVLEFNKGSCALHFDIDGTFESLSIY